VKHGYGAHEAFTFVVNGNNVVHERCTRQRELVYIRDATEDWRIRREGQVAS
jgi:hypothetical protein